jgi:hypothetical protein
MLKLIILVILSITADYATTYLFLIAGAGYESNPLFAHFNEAPHLVWRDYIFTLTAAVVVYIVAVKTDAWLRGHGYRPLVMEFLWRVAVPGAVLRFYAAVNNLCVVYGGFDLNPFGMAPVAAMAAGAVYVSALTAHYIMRFASGRAKNL